ncbi:unnamed protein product [Durusdinium trenchii]|uniref:Uncharacterized protein n=2 Tax=Durusdinium trenchii TaxID=1381693 RepID=A0ABP0Q6A2_9DINO
MGKAMEDMRASAPSFSPKEKSEVDPLQVGKGGGKKYTKKESTEPEIGSGNANAWANLGHAGGGRVKGVNYDKKSCYERALECDDKFAKVWYLLGIAGGGSVKGVAYDKKSCYTRALECDNKDANAWANLGNAGGGRVKGANYDKKGCYT